MKTKAKEKKTLEFLFPSFVSQNRTYIMDRSFFVLLFVCFIDSSIVLRFVVNLFTSEYVYNG